MRKRVSGKNGGVREALGEAWHGIPYAGLRWVARVTYYGAKKYEFNNWHGLDFDDIEQCPLNHAIGHAVEATQYKPGDPQRIWNLAKAAWNCLAQIWWEDQLAKPAAVEEFLESMKPEDT